MVSSTHSPALEKLLERHCAEVARIRERLGDPTEALGRIVRDTFGDPEALDRAFHDATEGGSIWNDDERDEQPAD